MKKVIIVFLSLLIIADLSMAAQFNLKPKDTKEEKKYIPEISGYTQIKLDAGGGRTLEAVELGDVKLKISGELQGGVFYVTGINLKDAADDRTITLEKAYLDIADLIGGGSVFRFGRFKIPFGYDLFLSSSARPYITRAYYNNNFWSAYDFGVQNFSSAKGATYELALVNGEGSPTDSSKAKDFVGRYIMKMGKDMEVGISEYLGTYNQKNRNNFGIYLKSAQGAFDAVFEYVNGTDRAGTNRTLDFHNVITQKMSSQLESVIVYESADPNIDAAGDSILAYTFGMNFYKTPEVKFAGNAHFIKTETAADYTKSALGMVQVIF